MARTTVNIATPILNDLKELQAREGVPLGQLMTDLLADALSRRQERRPARPEFQWHSQAMGVRIDLADKDALYAVLDGPEDDTNR